MVSMRLNHWAFLKDLIIFCGIDIDKPQQLVFGGDRDKYFTITKTLPLKLAILFTYITKDFAEYIVHLSFSQLSTKQKTYLTNH